MNVLGSEENHIRAISPQKLENNYDSNEAITFYGCEYPHLTNEQKQVLNYLNTEYQTKAIQQEMKSLIKKKFMRINHKQEQKKKLNNLFEQINTIDTIQKNEKSSKRIPLTPRPRKKILTEQSKRIPMAKSNDNRTLKEKFNNNLIEIFRDYSSDKKKEPTSNINNNMNNSTLFKMNKITEALEIKKWMRDHRSLTQKSSKIPENEIKLENIEKYNIQFIDYLKKKSDKKIEADKIKRLISKKQNIIEKYQQHLLQEIQLQPKNKESIRKCFQEINSETRQLMK